MALEIDPIDSHTFRKQTARLLLFVGSALAGSRHVAIGHHNDFLKTPNVVTQASSHTRSDSQRLVDSGEIVVYVRTNLFSRMPATAQSLGLSMCGNMVLMCWFG